jgi:hypothetical protein
MVDFLGFKLKGLLSSHNEPALEDWPPFNQKRHSMSLSSLPFSALIPPSLPQAFGGASLMPLMRVEDFVELQIAFLSTKHQKILAEWGPFYKKVIPCLCISVSLSSRPFSALTSLPRSFG